MWNSVRSASARSDGATFVVDAEAVRTDRGREPVTVDGVARTLAVRLGR